MPVSPVSRGSDPVRFAVNVVSGWFKDEFTALGEPWLEHDERYRRSEEFIRALRKIWTEDHAELAGDFYRLRDFSLKPSMGPAHITPGWFALDKDITVGEDGTLTVAPGSAEALAQVTDQFSAALGGRTTLLAAAG
ncbi:LLM class flavin-dependent oxidoreductase [Streptomyces nodosus]|uniref:LLM class flavin-dependent oxidoreductase n=1 Tax=Streptomyces nodosus TaxID=40318 RepID=UPI003454B407